MSGGLSSGLAGGPAAPGGAPDVRRRRAPLLAFVTDAPTETVLRGALQGQLADGSEFLRGDLATAARHLAHNPSPQILLVDTTGTANTMTALETLSQLVEPDVRVIAIGEEINVALYRGLTRGLGVLEYLYKPLSPEMVSRLIGPLLVGAPAASLALRSGRLIAITGVHGGVGASTIAANLAWYLAEHAGRPTLLLDGDLYGAGAAMLVGAKPGAGLRAALGDPDRVDELFIDRTAQIIGDRLSVLSGEGRLIEPPNLAPEGLARLIDTLRRHFRLLVCDAAVPASPIGQGLFDMANQRVLVTDPTVAGARDLLRYLALLPQGAQASSQTALIVVNHVGRKGSLPLAQFEEAVGAKADLVIPHIQGALHEAANLGEMAARTHKLFRRSMAELAAKAASVETLRTGWRGWLRR